LGLTHQNAKTIINIAGQPLSMKNGQATLIANTVQGQL